VQERKAQLNQGANAQPSNKLNHSRQSSAVDAVLQKLLGSSSRQDSTHQFTKGHRELLASKRSLLMIDKDRDEPLLPQNITQEKQKQIEPKEPGRSSSNNRGR
jgi:uncharacterized protein YqeY